MWRPAGLVIALLLAAAAAQLIWRVVHPSPHPAGTIPRPVARAGPPEPPAPPAPPVPAGDCPPAPQFADAAAANAASATAAAWSLFGRPETGWAIYAPLAAHEVRSGCRADQPGFAAALAAWQRGHGLAATGIMDRATLDALRILWLKRRQFLTQTQDGACPAPPAPSELAQAAPEEGYAHKPIQLRPAALAAYRAMLAAGRAESPAIAADHRLLTIFSGFRSPEEDAAHCQDGGDCGTPARAHCSAHQTGTAVDLYLGAAPGFAPESSADENRLYQARSPAYLWMVANAARFGFTPYPFEPWHWEWTGGR